MLSSCSGRLLGGGGGGSERGPTSSASFGSSSSRRHHTSQVELLISSATSSSLENSPDGQRNSLANGRDLHVDANLVQWSPTRNGAALYGLSGEQNQQQEASANFAPANVVPSVRHALGALTRDPSLNGNLPPQPKPVRRNLQYRPIHQQLQKIYGNKLQEFEQLNRQKHQPQKGPTANSGESQRTLGMSAKKQEHAFTTTGRPYQDHHHHHHSHHYQQDQQPPEQALFYQQEQTYDSLNVADQPPPSASQARPHQLPPKHQEQQQQQQSFYDFNPQPPPTGRHTGSKGRPIRDQNNNIMSRLSETSEVEPDDENDENDEENGFLLHDDAQRLARQSSMVLMSSRKKQMESLHYATATAAALLNVTASAAAAFVASDRNLAASHKPHQKVPQTHAAGRRLVEEARETDPGLDGPCQIAPERPHQHHEHCRQYYNYSEQQRRRNLQMHQYQNNQRRPPCAQLQPPLRAQKPPPSSRPFEPYRVNSQQQQNQAGLNGFANQHQLMPPAARPQPLHPPTHYLPTRPEPVPPTHQQLEMMRRYRHHMLQKSTNQAPLATIYGSGIYGNTKEPKVATVALAMGGVPALAILQPVGKSSEADLVARLAAQHKQQQRLASAAASLDPQLLMLASGQLQSNPATKPQRTDLFAQPDSHPVAYGLIVPSKSNKRQPQPIYSATRLLAGKNLEHNLARSHYKLGNIKSNLSDASGQSNLPLMLNHALVKPKASLLDKISHIDLTVFWWVLLTVCLLFITTVVAITRYLI